MKIAGVKVDTSELTAMFTVDLEDGDTLGDVLRVANAIEGSPRVVSVVGPGVASAETVATIRDAIASRPDELRLARALETIEELRKRVDGINSYTSEIERLYMALRSALRINAEVEPEKALEMATRIEQESRRHSPTDQEQRLSALLSENAKHEAEVGRLTAALTERDATCAKLTVVNEELSARLEDAGRQMSDMGTCIDVQRGALRALARAVGASEDIPAIAILGAIERLVAENARLKAALAAPASDPCVGCTHGGIDCETCEQWGDHVRYEQRMRRSIPTCERDLPPVGGKGALDG